MEDRNMRVPGAPTLPFSTQLASNGTSKLLQSEYPSTFAFLHQATPQRSSDSDYYEQAQASIRNFTKFTEVQLLEIQTTTEVVSVFSFIGCVFIITCYCCFKDLRKFSGRLVLFLTLADLGASVWPIFWVYNNVHDEGEATNLALSKSLCNAQAVFSVYFQMASLCWQACICFTLDYAVLRRKTNVTKLSFPFHLFSWGLPIFYTVPPLMYGDYTQGSGSWCWVHEEDNSDIRLLAEKGLTYALCVVLVSYQVAVFWRVHFQVAAVRAVLDTINVCAVHDAGMLRVGHRQNRLLRLRFYPFIVTVCWGVASVNRVNNFIRPHDPSFVLHLLHASFMSAQGFFNAVAYGFTTELYEQVSRGLESNVIPENEDDVEHALLPYESAPICTCSLNRTAPVCGRDPAQAQVINESLRAQGLKKSRSHSPQSTLLYAEEAEVEEQRQLIRRNDSIESIDGVCRA